MIWVKKSGNRYKVVKLLAKTVVFGNTVVSQGDCIDAVILHNLSFSYKIHNLTPKKG